MEAIAGLQGLPLPDFGAYEFSLYFGDGPAPVKTLGLTVVQLKPNAAKPPGEAPPQNG